MQLEARYILDHAGVFGIDIFACVFLQKPEVLQLSLGDKNLKKMKIVACFRK